MSRKLSAGFSLIELMVTVSIIAILMGVAIPLYRGYVRTSEEGVLVYNISTIEVFQEDHRLRTGSYLTEGASSEALFAELGWQRPVDESITYALAPAGSGYAVTATSPTGVTVCLRFPGKERCDAN